MTSLIVNKQKMEEPQTAVLPLFGRIRWKNDCIQLIVDAGLLAPFKILYLLMLYPLQVKHLEFTKGSWRLSVNVCCVLCRCGAVVSMGLWCLLGQ